MSLAKKGRAHTYKARGLATVEIAGKLGVTDVVVRNRLRAGEGQEPARRQCIFNFPRCLCFLISNFPRPSIDRQSIGLPVEPREKQGLVALKAHARIWVNLPFLRQLRILRIASATSPLGLSLNTT